jgi:hypothetical protein
MRFPNWIVKLVDGVGRDKLPHALVSAILALAVKVLLIVCCVPYSWAAALAIIITIVIGVWKETKDETFDWKDLAADVFGAIVGGI